MGSTAALRRHSVRFGDRNLGEVSCLLCFEIRFCRTAAIAGPTRAIDGRIGFLFIRREDITELTYARTAHLSLSIPFSHTVSIAAAAAAATSPPPLAATTSDGHLQRRRSHVCPCHTFLRRFPAISSFSAPARIVTANPSCHGSVRRRGSPIPASPAASPLCSRPLHQPPVFLLLRVSRTRLP